MAKVKVTLEAEIDDLEGFWPDDPKGVTAENVMCVVRIMEQCILERRLADMSNRRYDAKTRAALKKHFEEDRTLVERLLKGAKVEVTP